MMRFTWMALVLAIGAGLLMWCAPPGGAQQQKTPKVKEIEPLSPAPDPPPLLPTPDRLSSPSDPIRQPPRPMLTRAPVLPGSAAMTVPQLDVKVVELKRLALWKAMQEVCPKEYQEVNLYGEDPALTELCFVSRGRVFLFARNEGRLKELACPEPLGRVNRITYETDANSSGKGFVLWQDGEPRWQFMAY